MHLRTLVLPALGLAAVLNAQTPVSLSLQQVATGLTRLNDIAHTDDDRLFLALQAGVVRILDSDGATLLPTPFLNITAQVNSTENEQGLLGLTFDPDYGTNGYFYVYYTFGSGTGTSRISRFTVSSDPNVADQSTEQVLYTQAQPYINHNGGDMEFGPDGYLYIGFGDGGNSGDPQNHAQNITDVLGSMIRIDVSGGTGWTVPPDNPFVGVADAKEEIWLHGLRNPWRWGFDRLTGDLWIGDVGQDTYEEVDFWPAGDNSGGNFGWHCYEGNSAFNTAGCNAQNTYVAPVTVHPQSQQGWCSVIGGRVYRGPTYWRIEGRYIYTDYCGGQLYSLTPNGIGGYARAQLGTSSFGASCIGENRQGELYLGNNATGVLSKIKEACPVPAPVISDEANLLTSTPAVSYLWYRDGQPIAGATDPTYAVTGTGFYQVLATFAGGCSLLSNTIYIGFTGVDDHATEDVTVHPVPAKELLFIEGLDARATSLLLHDAAGCLVNTTAIADRSGRIALPVVGLANGLYMLSAADAQGAMVLRRSVMVQH